MFTEEQKRVRFCYKRVRPLLLEAENTRLSKSQWISSTNQPAFYKCTHLERCT